MPATNFMDIKQIQSDLDAIRDKQLMGFAHHMPITPHRTQKMSYVPTLIDISPFDMSAGNAAMDRFQADASRLQFQLFRAYWRERQ